MYLNIHPRRNRRVAAVVLLLGLGAGRLPGQACPAASGLASAAGWRAYRADSLAAASDTFDAALRRCSANLDAAVGLGYVALRRNQVARADSLFRRVVQQNPASVDGWDGLSRAAWRAGDRPAAADAARHVVALDPSNADARALLDRLEPDWDRRRRTAPRPGTLQLPARIRGDRFEILGTDGWRTFYIKGINLGVALPGRFPSEFPTDSATYAGWLDTIAGLRANTLRPYTILPPQFYRALRAWNIAHPTQPLRLMHGVWTELPPDNDFAAPAWQAEFRAEMRRVIDVVHGTADIAPRPGHAAGRYDADVSAWTVGFIIGREWEPYSVKAFDAAHRDLTEYYGRYLTLAAGTPMDAWLVEQCDYMLVQEADRYNTLRPIAYTNWPTLDPLTHPTEAGTAEELAWRKRAGRPVPRPRLEFENDAVSLDAALVRPTTANAAGWFAAFHAYPYYPDFMVSDPGYGMARSSEGRSNYFGYLTALRRHLANVPLVIAEYGVPSSRGIAHLQPQGWNHGGHDEREMGRVDARLTREIHEAGAAGAILFAWTDEWFKRNWLVTDFELPAERNRLWDNVMDPEQHYGLLGQYPGAAGVAPVLGGDAAGWRRLGATGAGGLRAGADAAYVYLAVELPGLDWTRQGVEIGIDTYLRDHGQHRLPASGVRSPIGFEFAADLASPADARLRVAPDYNRYAAIADSAHGDDLDRFYRRPVTITDRTDGRLDPMFVITNRSRYGRDGTFFRATGYDRGMLRFGTERTSSLSDWYYDTQAGLLELRLAWDLLNVTDPSSRTVLYDESGTGDFGTRQTDSFHFLVARYDKSGSGAVKTIGPAAWNWQGWSAPRSHARLKPAADSMRATWSRLP